MKQLSSAKSGKRRYQYPLDCADCGKHLKGPYKHWGTDEGMYAHGRCIRCHNKRRRTGKKPCPVCGNLISSAALVCRACRVSTKPVARYTVTVPADAIGRHTDDMKAAAQRIAAEHVWAAGAKSLAIPQNVERGKNGFVIRGAAYFPKRRPPLHITIQQPATPPQERTRP